MENVKLFLQLLNKELPPPQNCWHYIREYHGDIILCIMSKTWYQDVIIMPDEFNDPETLCKEVVKLWHQASEERKKKNVSNQQVLSKRNISTRKKFGV